VRKDIVSYGSGLTRDEFHLDDEMLVNTCNIISQLGDTFSSDPMKMLLHYTARDLELLTLQ
jgi:hypothetical protein